MTDVFEFYPITVTVSVTPEQRKAVVRNATDLKVEALATAAWDICTNNDIGELGIEGVSEEVVVIADRYIAWRAVQRELIGFALDYQVSRMLVTHCYGDELICDVAIAFRLKSEKDYIYFKMATTFEVLKAYVSTR